LRGHLREEVEEILLREEEEEGFAPRKVEGEEIIPQEGEGNNSRFPEWRD